MGVSSDTFYRYQELVETGRIDELINQSRKAPNLKNRVDRKLNKSFSNTPSISLLMGKSEQAMNYVNSVCLFLQVACVQSGFAMI